MTALDVLHHRSPPPGEVARRGGTPSLDTLTLEDGASEGAQGKIDLLLEAFRLKLSQGVGLLPIDSIRSIIAWMLGTTTVPQEPAYPYRLATELDSPATNTPLSTAEIQHLLHGGVASNDEGDLLYDYIDRLQDDTTFSDVATDESAQLLAETQAVYDVLQRTIADFSPQKRIFFFPPQLWQKIEAVVTERMQQASQRGAAESDSLYTAVITGMTVLCLVCNETGQTDLPNTLSEEDIARICFPAVGAPQRILTATIQMATPENAAVLPQNNGALLATTDIMTMLGDISPKDHSNLEMLITTLQAQETVREEHLLALGMVVYQVFTTTVESLSLEAFQQLLTPDLESKMLAIAGTTADDHRSLKGTFDAWKDFVAGWFFLQMVCNEIEQPQLPAALENDTLAALLLPATDAPQRIFETIVQIQCTVAPGAGAAQDDAVDDETAFSSSARVLTFVNDRLPESRQVRAGDERALRELLLTLRNKAPSEQDSLPIRAEDRDTLEPALQMYRSIASAANETTPRNTPAFLKAEIRKKLSDIATQFSADMPDQAATAYGTVLAGFLFLQEVCNLYGCTHMPEHIDTAVLKDLVFPVEGAPERIIIHVINMLRTESQGVSAAI